MLSIFPTTPRGRAKPLTKDGMYVRSMVALALLIGFAWNVQSTAQHNHMVDLLTASSDAGALVALMDYASAKPEHITLLPPPVFMRGHR